MAVFSPFWEPSCSALVDIFTLFVKVYSNMFASIGDRRMPSQIETFLSGALAGITASVICFPADMVRTRILGKGGEKYKGMIDAYRTIVAKEGFGYVLDCFWENCFVFVAALHYVIDASDLDKIVCRALYKGIKPALLSQAPAVSAL